jgi:hypothetical protein
VIILGKDDKTGKLITLDQQARSRGVYVIGSTGTGKTTFLQSIAYQDMLAGDGLCVLDPHGDMIDWLLPRVPQERVEDVVLFNPADVDRPFGLNLLQCEDRDDPLQVRWIVSTIVVTLRRLFAYSWGPRLEYVLNHTLWTAMKIDDSTLIEVLLLLTDPEYQQEHTSNLTDNLLVKFWQEINNLTANSQHELISSTVNKLTPFLLDWGMRNIVGQTQSTINIREMMDDRKILLVNLSKGDLGENNAALLGSVLISLILIAALSRRDMPPEQRKQKQFHVIVDEYQNFASESFSILQSEARKYAVDLMVAHQFRDQLDIESRGSALNVGNFMSFRVTGTDGQELAAQFNNTPPEPDYRYEPIRSPDPRSPGYFIRGREDIAVANPQRLYSDMQMEHANTLTNLDPYHAWVKMIVPDPQPDKPNRLTLAEYQLAMIDPTEVGSEAYYGGKDINITEQIRAQSQRLAPTRQEVEASISERTGGAADLFIPAASATVDKRK